MQVAAFVIFMLICLCLGAGLFFPGLVFYIVGRKKQWKRGVRIAFLIMTIVGGLLILGPLTFFGFIRAANGEPQQEGIYQKMKDTATYQYDKVDGRWCETFDFNDEHYIEIREEPFFDVELTDATPEKKLTKENAVLNIQPKGSLWRRILFGLFGANEKITLFRIDSDAGITLLTDSYSSYCKASELDKAKAFYTDFANYQFYYLDDIDYSKAKKLALDGETINALKTVSKKKTQSFEDGDGYEILCKSRDGAFECVVMPVKRKGDWYLQVGELDDDFVTETYAKLPSDLAAQIEKALKEAE